MKKIVRLTERDLTKLVKRVMNEDLSDRKGELYSSINKLIDREFDDVEPSDIVDVLKNILDSHKAMEYRHRNKIEPISTREVLRNFKKY